MSIIDQFLEVARQSVEYDHFAKEKFHSLGKRVMKEIAKRLELDPGTYDVRSNKGGIAVSGEVTLHGEDIHVWMQQSCVGPEQTIIIFRRCNGRKDYTGETNNTRDAEELAHIDNLVDQIQNVRQRGAVLAW